MLPGLAAPACTDLMCFSRSPRVAHTKSSQWGHVCERVWRTPTPRADALARLVWLVQVRRWARGAGCACLSGADHLAQQNRPPTPRRACCPPTRAATRTPSSTPRPWRAARRRPARRRSWRRRRWQARWWRRQLPHQSHSRLRRRCLRTGNIGVAGRRAPHSLPHSRSGSGGVGTALPSASCLRRRQRQSIGVVQFRRVAPLIVGRVPL